MSRKIIITMPAAILLVFVSACNLPAGNVVVSGTTPAITVPNPATTVPINTQVAQMVASTQAAQTALANAVAASLTALPTNTPQFTFTPSLTPTMTFTFTPSVAMVTVSANTYCRTGPGDPYAILGVLSVGQSAEVVARSAQNDSWIIKLPPNNTTCWLWNQYATVTGNTAGLPVLNPPPTPTPAGSFIVAFSSKQTCAVGFGLKFQITNNGSLSWESNQVSATFLSSSITKTAQYDTFPNYNSSGCGLISSALNLDPGESGTTSVFGFGSNPSGHNFTATIKVCSQNGLAGVCLSKTISFTP
jgi:hypothetical protein